MKAADVEARGVYLDIKGLRDRPPVLLGIAVDDTFEQVVTDAVFGDAALAKDLRVNAFDYEIRTLMARCARESRRIFAFSSHILAVVDHYTPAATAFAGLFEDAQEMALLCHEKANRRDTTAWSLADHLQDLGQPQPKHLGAKHTASRLRYVELQLRKHGAYAAISGGAKAKWTKVLQQNRSDTCGTRAIVLRAAVELG
ncbi:MAG: hypothetical protein O2782_19275 [bacterium]|nr:hypothetical protein [bacterium]